jgi:hypothetical protein
LLRQPLSIKKSYAGAIQMQTKDCYRLKMANSRTVGRKKMKIRVADPGGLYWIPDPKFSIPDPISRVKKIPRSGSSSASKNFSILTQKIVSTLSEI